MNSSSRKAACSHTRSAKWNQLLAASRLGEAHLKNRWQVLQVHSGRRLHWMSGCLLVPRSIENWLLIREGPECSRLSTLSSSCPPPPNLVKIQQISRPLPPPFESYSIQDHSSTRSRSASKTRPTLLFHLLSVRNTMHVASYTWLVRALTALLVLMMSAAALQSRISHVVPGGSCGKDYPQLHSRIRAEALSMMQSSRTSARLIPRKIRD